MCRARLAAALVALLASVAACASPFADDEPDASPSDTLDRRLAGRPQIVDDRDVGSPSTSSPVEPEAGSGGDPAPSPGPGEAGSETSTSAPSQPAGDPDPPEPTFRVVGEAADREGDHGIEGPDHADVMAVVVEARGDTARISVEFLADVPERLGEGEVMGVGVDLYRPGNDDDSRSDYQVFADGGPEGWFAYLQTPDGFVAYPGRFVLAGRRMIWELPWTSVGNFGRGEFRSFADWSGPGVAVVNKVSQDWVPDRGRSSFRR